MASRSGTIATSLGDSSTPAARLINTSLTTHQHQPRDDIIASFND